MSEKINVKLADGKSAEHGHWKKNMQKSKQMIRPVVDRMNNEPTPGDMPEKPKPKEGGDDNAR